MDGVHLMNLLAVVISFYNEPCTREKKAEIEEQPNMTFILKMSAASEGGSVCLFTAYYSSILHRNPIMYSQKMKLRGLVPNSYIHVSVSDAYILRIGLPIWLQQNRQTDHGKI